MVVGMKSDWGSLSEWMKGRILFLLRNHLLCDWLNFCVHNNFKVYPLFPRKITSFRSLTLQSFPSTSLKTKIPLPFAAGVLWQSTRSLHRQVVYRLRKSVTQQCCSNFHKTISMLRLKCLKCVIHRSCTSISIYIVDGIMLVIFSKSDAHCIIKIEKLLA